MKPHLLRILVIICSVFGALPADCRAGFTVFRPMPYASAADSPFPVDGSNPNFYLEDFEPDEACVPGDFVVCGVGKFDAPGARMIYGTALQGSSVDADDFMIDGSGFNGHSAVATGVAIIGSSTLVAIGFEFDRYELGFWPTAVGMVLTDGAGEFSGLSIFDADGNRSDFPTSEIQLDPNATSDDRFIGVVNPNGISMVMFGKIIFDATPDSLPRLDHFQYGFLIPEPPIAHLIFFAWAMLGALARPRRKLQDQ